MEIKVCSIWILNQIEILRKMNEVNHKEHRSLVWTCLKYISYFFKESQMDTYFQAWINYQITAYFHMCLSLVCCSSPHSGYCEIVGSAVIKLGEAGLLGWLLCGLVHYLAGFIQTLLSDNFCPPLLRGSCQQYQISRGQCHIVSRSQALSSEIVHTNYSTELISLLRMSKFNTWESHATSRNIFHQLY